MPKQSKFEDPMARKKRLEKLAAAGDKAKQKLGIKDKKEVKRKSKGIM